MLLISDGADSCAQRTQADTVQTTLDRLAAAAASLLASGVRTYAVAFGAGGSSQSVEREQQLAQIASSGGTGDVILAPDGDSLVQQLAALSEAFISCDMEVDAVNSEFDHEAGKLFLDGVAVPRDTDDSGEGWRWTDEAGVGIELRGSYCDVYKAGRLQNVTLEFDCVSSP